MVTLLIYLDVHAIRIEQKHAMRASCAVFEIYGMVPIEISALWDRATIRCRYSLNSPYSPE